MFAKIASSLLIVLLMFTALSFAIATKPSPIIKEKVFKDTIVITHNKKTLLKTLEGRQILLQDKMSYLNFKLFNNIQIDIKCTFWHFNKGGVVSELVKCSPKVI